MQSYLQLLITVEGNAASLIDHRDRKSGVRKLYNYLGALIAGGRHASIDVASYADEPVAASTTIDLDGVAADDTVTVCGVTFTAKASPSGVTQFDSDIGAADLEAKINAHTDLSKGLVATVDGTSVVITSLQTGVVGNLLTASATLDSTTTAHNFSGGVGGVPANLYTYRMGL